MINSKFEPSHYKEMQEILYALFHGEDISIYNEFIERISMTETREYIWLVKDWFARQIG